ncbi:tRNA-binding protein [Flagellimonas marina]|uniref:tRNA-binding protein n=1 Tax=Flagellimonas marina TaxID=1775168 RepID=A0ABV8PM98_9FLAO
MENEMAQDLTWDEFMKVEMVVGTIISAEEFKEVRNPAYKMMVDFGDLGTRKTSAQITKLYNPKELMGKQVVAVINFPPKQIANLMSECLVLGCVGDHKEITLLQPERKVKNGTRIG